MNTEAVLDDRLRDYARQGKALEERTGLPYAPLLSEQPPYEARIRFPFACAARWGALPVAYDAETSLLTVAVSDPEQGAAIEAVYRFFVMPCSLSFRIAGEMEINEVFERHFDGRSGSGKKWLRRSLFTPAARAAAPQEAAVAPLTVERPPVVQALAAPAAETAAWTERISRSLLNAIGFLVSRELEQDAAALQAVRTRVRYSQLLAGRLGMPSDLTDTLLASAWLSGLPDWKTVVARLDVPYRVAEVLAGTTSEADSPAMHVFTVVSAYQDLVRCDPLAARNTQLLRRHLTPQGPGAEHQVRIIEALLQILMDEQFLTPSQGSAGTLLVIEPEEGTASNLTALLTGDGYRVLTAAGAAAARDYLASFMPDAILVARDLPDAPGLALCQELKQDARTSRVPVFVLLRHGGDRQAAEALRAGADDVVSVPVSAELLVLKLRRVMTGKPDTSDDTGVQGNLSDLGFTDLIQILAAGGKRMELALTHEGRGGRVCLDGNAVVHAEFGDLSGEEAFCAFMRWTSGEFRAVPREEFSTQTMNAPVMGLLMEGARRSDEHD